MITSSETLYAFIMIFVLILCAWDIYFLAGYEKSSGGIVIATMVVSAVLIVCGAIVYFVSIAMQVFDKAVVTLLVVSTGYVIYRLAKYYTEESRLNKQLYGLLIVYLLVMLYITLVGRVDGSNNTIILRPFASDTIGRSFNGMLKHLFLNTVMFVPVGCLFGLSAERVAKIRYGMLIGLVFTTIIEGFQLILHSGECDINDVIGNTAGAVIGMVIAILSWKYTNRKYGATQTQRKS